MLCFPLHIDDIHLLIYLMYPHDSLKRKVWTMHHLSLESLLTIIFQTENVSVVYADTVSFC